MILKSLRRRLVRTALTILGIATGVAAVVALGALAEGIAVNYGSSLAFNSQILVTQANKFDVVFSNLDEDLGQRLLTVPDVATAEPGVFRWLTLGDVPYFLIFGYEPDSVAVKHYAVVDGKPIAGSKEIVVGRRGAEALGKEVGGTLNILGVSYRIVGIYETGQGLEESGGVVTLADAQVIAHKERQVSFFQVGLRRGADVGRATARIAALEQDIQVSLASDYTVGQQWTTVLQGFVRGVSVLAILAGGLGMTSAMLMGVIERTGEIGVLRAVGWTRRGIMRLILGESMILSVAGGLLGCSMGVLLTRLVACWPEVAALLENRPSSGVVLQGFGLALGLGLAGGLYPAWMAANLQPVDALRHQGGSSGQAQRWAAKVGDLSFRNLWRRRARTVVSLAGIGVGVATLVMLGGLIDGLIGQLNTLAGSRSAGTITVMQREVADIYLSSLDEQTVRQIRAISHVRAVSPFMMGIVTTAAMPTFAVYGLDPGSPAMQHYRLLRGRYVRRPYEIVLGKLAAATYKLDVGDTIALHDNRYKIVGIYETATVYEDNGGILAVGAAQRLFGRPRVVTLLFVEVDQPAQATAVVAAINRRVPGVRATLSSEFAQQTNDIASLTAMTVAVRMLALLVGAILVANTMLMAVYERTQEIGMLRAVGWSGRRILAEILRESLYLCGLATVLGCILGVMALTLAACAPFLRQYIAPVWTPVTFLTAVATALGLGIIGALYPAWHASHLQPADALRHE